MIKKVLIVAGLVAVASWLLVRSSLSDATDGGGSDASSTRNSSRSGKRSGKLAKARERIDAAMVTLTDRSVKPRRKISVIRPADIESTWVYEDGTPWPEEQRNLMRGIVDASDEDDLDALTALSKDVSNCDNEELRERFVEELGWFGEKAFVELADFISDPSDEVAEAAKSQIADAFRDIDNDGEKAAMCVLMSRAVSDSEVLENFTDELFSMDEVVALQAIIDIIGSGTPNAKAAAEAAYEGITDEKWSDFDAAEIWLEENCIGEDDEDDPKDSEDDVTVDSEEVEHQEY